MRSLIYLAAMAVLVVIAASCNLTGPSEPLTGNWRSNVGDKFTFAYMSVEQHGDEISGTACASAPGVGFFYKAVPVRGEFPSVLFDVAATYTQPCCAAATGTRFSGRQDSTGDIIGVYNNREVRFTRTDAVVCQD